MMGENSVQCILLSWKSYSEGGTNGVNIRKIKPEVCKHIKALQLL